MKNTIIFHFSILLHHGAPVDCTDERGYTPLFLASKVGSLSNIIELIDHGANVNYVSKEDTNSKQGTTKKTPIFRATNFETVMLLLKSGADPTHKAKFQRSDNTVKYLTAIQHLLKYNVDCANAILDHGLKKENDDDLIMDFLVFSNYENDESGLDILAEVKHHSPVQLVKANDKPPILLHPLLQIFMNLKFNSFQKIYFIQFLFQVLLVATFTAWTVHYVQLTSCKLNIKMETFENQYGVNGTHLRDGKNLQGK